MCESLEERSKLAKQHVTCLRSGFIHYNKDKIQVLLKGLSRIKSREININTYPAKLIYLNFQQLEVVSCYRDLQHQVADNCSYLFYFTTTICKFSCSFPITVIWSTNKTGYNDSSHDQQDKG